MIQVQETVSQTKINSAGNGNVFHVDYNRKICNTCTNKVPKAVRQLDYKRNNEYL